MAFIGNIVEFVEQKDSIHDYLDRLNFYFIANSVDDDVKKRAILLTVIGQRQFRLIKDLCQPHSPGDKSFNELCDLLKNVHSPPPPKFLQRARFDAKTRKPSESIQSFLADLRNIAEFCQFGDTLNDRLCEKFVTGVNHEQIQRKLLMEKELTLDKAIDIALTFQLTTEGAHQLTHNTDSVNYTSSKPATGTLLPQPSRRTEARATQHSKQTKSP